MSKRALLLLLAGATGCSGAPVVPESSAPASHSTLPRAAAARLARPVVLFTTTTDGGEQVRAYHTSEERDLALTGSGEAGRYLGSLGDRRVLIGAHQGGGLQLLAVAVDDGSRERLGAVADPRGELSFRRVEAAATGWIVELTTAARPGQVQLLALGATGAVRLADNASLVAVAGDQVALLEGSDRADGRGRLVVVAADGARRQMVDAAARVVDRRGHGASLELLVDGRGSGDDEILTLRIADRVVGRLGRGAGLAPLRFAGSRILAQRGPSLLSLASGHREVLLADGRFLTLLADGRAVILRRDGSLVAQPSEGGAATILDPLAGHVASIGAVTPDRVVYVAEPGGPRSLRSARLDGGGAVVLCQRERWLPLIGGVGEGRVVFHRSLDGSPEGGAVYAVPIDGGELLRLGGAAPGLGGPNPTRAFTDHDFEALTSDGRVVLEGEVEGLLGAQLIVTSPEEPWARGLTPQGAHSLFLALLE